jgi:phosphoribosylaminoimidazole-succinocarboxamide synthase
MHDDYKEYRERIASQLVHTMRETDLPLAQKKVGKVRDSYRWDDGHLLLVTTDRQSAFDRVLAAIPFKGAVLNLTSAWWFGQSGHIVKNHLVSVPHPNASLVLSCDVFPIEMVVRGYITGTTDTSLWTHYEKGARTYCGNELPEGLRKNQKLERPLLTPTTKEAVHDRPISPTEIVSEGWMTEEDWKIVSQKALELFEFGQQQAAKNGLILVDTKYEFGRDSKGTIRIIDELHTPDSSRYWIADTYADRFSRGEEPENIDKEFLRLWFRKVCDPYHDEILPEAPQELVVELSLRYIRLYEMITGQQFPFDEISDREITPAEELVRVVERLRTQGNRGE